jgi:hypothetical protein
MGVEQPVDPAEPCQCRLLVQRACQDARFVEELLDASDQRRIVAGPGRAVRSGRLDRDLVSALPGIEIRLVSRPGGVGPEP